MLEESIQTRYRDSYARRRKKNIVITPRFYRIMHWLLNYEALYDMKKEKLRYMELEIQPLTFKISLIMQGYGARKKQKEIEWKG